MTKTCLLASVAAFGLPAIAPAIAHAQDAQPERWTPADIIVTGERQSYRADEASVTRTPVPLIETPQSIQVLTRAFIRDQELNTLDEALRNVSGVVPTLPSEAVLANPIVRGFEAEIFTDGLIGYGDTAVIDPASLWNAERVEVAKGPTSTLFGGGTGAPLGGLINIVSKTANQTRAFGFRVRAGSFDEYSGAVDANVPLSPTLAIRLVGEAQTNGDYIDEVEVDRTLIAPSIRFAPSDATEIVARLTHTRVEQLEYAGLPVQFRDDPRVDRNRFTGAVDAPRTTIDNLTYQVELKQRLSDSLTLNARLRRYESAFDERATTPFFGFFPCGAASLLNETSCPQVSARLPADVGEWTGDLSLTSEFSTGAVKHVVLAGVQADRTDYDAAIGFTLFTPFPFDYAGPARVTGFTEPMLNQFITNRYKTNAAYLQDQVTIGPVHLLGSIRYSELRLEEVAGGAGTNRTYREWDPRIGATLDLAEGVSLFAGYATGSRLAIFFTGAEPPVPERSESFEGGIKFGLARLGLSGTIAAYRIDRNNVPTPDPNTFGSSVQVGRQRSEGIEADLIFEPTPAFSLLASYAYTDARVVEDNAIPAGSRLPRVPEHSGRLAARYRVRDGGLKGLELGAGVTANSGAVMTLPNGAKTDGYAVVDALASYRIGRARIGLRIDNLLNTDYFIPYQYLAQDVVRPGNPRSAFVTLGFDL